MSLCHEGFLELARHAVFDEVAQAEGDLSDLLRGDCLDDMIYGLLREDW